MVTFGIWRFLGAFLTRKLIGGQLISNHEIFTRFASQEKSPASHATIGDLCWLQASGTGTFQTGTGAVTLNGDTGVCLGVACGRCFSASEIWGKICTPWEWSIYMKYRGWHLAARSRKVMRALKYEIDFDDTFGVPWAREHFQVQTQLFFYLNGALSRKWYNNGWRSTGPKQCSQELWRWAAGPMEPTIRHPSNGTVLPFAVPWVPSLIILQSSYLIYFYQIGRLWTIFDGVRRLYLESYEDDDDGADYAPKVAPQRKIIRCKNPKTAVS